MTVPKMLAPFLQKSQRRNNKLKKQLVAPPPPKSPVAVVKDVVLSPAMPFSPLKHSNNQNVNENGDPIIGLDTVEEDGSTIKSDKSIMEEDQYEEGQQEENTTTTTAVVLHEKPTAFELCDNDLIIESVRDVEEEEELHYDYDTKVMRDNNNAMSVYKANTEATTTSAEAIDFTAPEQKEEVQDEIEQHSIIELTDEKVQLEEQQQEIAVENKFIAALPASPLSATLLEQVSMRQQQEELAVEKELIAPLPASPPSVTVAQQVSTHQQQEDIQEFDFIKPIQAEVLHTVFVESKLDEEKKHAHFPIETTFKRHDSNAGFTSTCKKAIRGARSLIWKHDSPRRMNRTHSTKFDNNGSANPAGQEASANHYYMQTTYGAVKMHEEAAEETPIYHRRNTCRNYLVSATGEQQDPLENYMSPKIGTDAYDIKKLCDQSFFGRW